MVFWPYGNAPTDLRVTVAIEAEGKAGDGDSLFTAFTDELGSSLMKVAAVGGAPALLRWRRQWQL